MAEKSLHPYKIVQIFTQSSFRVFFLDECVSTNTEALLRMPNQDDFVLFSRSQIAGRGRRGRSWSSLPGKDLILSFGVKINTQLFCMSFLMMFVASLLLKILSKYATNLRIKWPNDIIDAQGRKLCGILIETIFDEKQGVVIGIGVNVNSQHRGEAVSLRDLVGNPLDLDNLYYELISMFFQDWYNLRPDTVLEIKNFWHKHISWIGKNVSIEQEHTLARGTLKGFTDLGEPILSSNGKEKIFFTGTMRLSAIDRELLT